MGWGKKSDQRCFYFFPIMLHFSYQYCTNLETDLEGLWCCVGAPKWTADWTHCESPSWHLLYIVWPFYIFLVVITSAFSLCFCFFSFIHFVLQASAICTVLESEFRQDVQLRSLMKNDINDKIKKGSRKIVINYGRGSVFILHSCMRRLLCVGLGKASPSCAVHKALRGNKYGSIYNKICWHFTLLSEL